MGEGDMSDEEAERYKARLQELQDLAEKRVQRRRDLAAIDVKQQEGGCEDV